MFTEPSNYYGGGLGAGLKAAAPNDFIGATVAEQPSSAVARNFSEAEKTAQVIAQLIDQIEQRASAVLRATGPEQGSAPTPVLTNSPLADAIAELNRDLSRSASRLDSLLRRVDL